MITRHASGRIYNYESCIGRITMNGTGFWAPSDFALGPGGSLYVISRGHELIHCHGITKCNLDEDLIWQDRGPGFCDGQSPWPSSVAMDSSENVYISDDYASRIFIYDKEGSFLTGWGRKGSGDGELNGPSGLAFDGEDNLYVVDALNHRVQKFSRDGAFLGKWGEQGSGEGQFNMPWGIAIDEVGYLYVVDWRNDRVQKLSPEGEYLATFGQPGSGDGELRRPTGVAVDHDGDVYVTDWGNHRLNIYASDGTPITAFYGDADSLSKWSQDYVDASPMHQVARQRADLTAERLFVGPIAVNVDDEGRIMVLEQQQCRIQIYVKERDFVDAPFNL